MNNPRPGFRSVAEYQASGLPWFLSGSVGTSAQEYDLPMVSRAVTIINNSSAGNFLLFGATQNGVTLGGNSLALDGGKQVRLEISVRDLWFKGQNSTVNFTVCAELTGIERKMMPYLTGTLTPSDPVASSSIYYPGIG